MNKHEYIYSCTAHIKGGPKSKSLTELTLSRITNR